MFESAEAALDACEMKLEKKNAIRKVALVSNEEIGIANSTKQDPNLVQTLIVSGLVETKLKDEFVSKEGWLKKRQQTGAGWDRRWFVLARNVLSYYTSEVCGTSLTVSSCSKLSEHLHFAIFLVAEHLLEKQQGRSPWRHSADI